MPADIKLDGDNVVVEGHTLQVRAVDLAIDGGPERRPGDNVALRTRRALVHDFGDGLTLNYGKDYQGGVKIEGPAQVTGKLDATEVAVSGPARVTGKLDATEVAVSGPARVAGKLAAAEVAVSGPARFAGKVEATELVVHGGGTVVDSLSVSVAGQPRRTLFHDTSKNALVVDGLRYQGGVRITGTMTTLGALVVTVRSRFDLIPDESIDVGEQLVALRSSVARMAETIEELEIRSRITSEAKHYTQEGWRLCGKCSGLSYAPNSSRSVCTADKGRHSIDGTAYVLFVKRSRYGGQAGWEWCRKCQLLSHGTAPTSGHCPAGDAHDRSGSPGYLVWAPDLAAGDPKDFKSEDGWRWCSQCFGLVRGPGACAAPGSGGRHVLDGSTYHLQV